MSKQKDRDEFIAIMTKEGVPLDAARALMRYSATLQRLAELSCSSEAADRDRVKCPGEYAPGVCLCRDYGSYDEQTPALTNRHGKIPRIAVKEYQTQRLAEKVCAKYGLKPDFSGDPRGAVLKIIVPSGRTNDWGQTGVCVP